jgi:hypothetical protein
MELAVELENKKQTDGYQLRPRIKTANPYNITNNRSLPPYEISRRLNNNLCLICAKPGHRKAECRFNKDKHDSPQIPLNSASKPTSNQTEFSDNKLCFLSEPEPQKVPLQYHFKTKHISGKKNTYADGLSRNASYEISNEELQQPNSRTILTSEHLCILSQLSQPNSDTLNKIRNSMKKDKLARNILKLIAKKSTKKYTLLNGLVYRNNMIVVFDENHKQLILKRCHDHITAGHGGVKKTIELITRQFTWPKLTHYVTQYIRQCQSCNMNKSTNATPSGSL